jgi:ATP-binding cassette subfamily B protein
VPDPAPAKLDRAARSASFRRLLALASEEKKLLAIGTVFLAVGSVAGLLYPQGLKYIIDSVLGPSGDLRREMIDKAAIAMVVIALAQGVAIATRYLSFSIAGERIVTRLRERLYRAIVSQEIAFFDERRTGELTSRLQSDTTVLQSAVTANISMGLRNLAQVVGGIGFLLWTSPLLTGLMLAVVPPVAIGAVFYGRRIRKLSKKVQDSLAEASEVADETIGGMRTVRSFAAEEMEAARYSGAVQKSFQLARSRAGAGASFMAAASFAAYTSAALVFWYGGRMVVDGRMTLGGLTAFLVYTLVVAFSLGAIADLWAEFMKALGAGQRVFDLLDRVPTMPASGGRIPASAEGHVHLDHVRFAYPTRKEVVVLDGLDLEIRPGEIVAMVGSSGAGKSTVSALLVRLYDPDRGRVTFDGVDVRELDPNWLRRQIGTVAQEPILFSTTIADNIRYGRPGATDEEVQAAAKLANAQGFIEKFPDGYKTLVGERGIQLSGGQKQRVAIARAVLKDPKLLILDEATSALDAESEHLVKDALDRLMRGRTTLIIAHRLSTVMDADRVVVLDGGKVAQTGNHRSLMSEEGLYKRLVERQFVAA